MFIRERIIMILLYTQNHSPSIHGDGWYVTVLFMISFPTLFMEIMFPMTELPMTAKIRIRAWSLKITSLYLEGAAGSVLERNWE